MLFGSIIEHEVDENEKALLLRSTYVALFLTLSLFVRKISLGFKGLRTRQIKAELC